MIDRREPTRIDIGVARDWCAKHGVPDYLTFPLARLISGVRRETEEGLDYFWKGVLIAVRNQNIDLELEREDVERMKRIAQQCEEDRVNENC